MPLAVDQYNALDEFYEALNGWSWHYSAGMPWDFNGNYSAPCNGWSGIHCVCNPVYCHVSELSLDSVNARGTLPSSIRYLNTLTLLSLENNLITGVVPTEIGLITGLTVLDFNDNCISGVMPSEIGQLRYLKKLEFDYNHITGLTSGIGQLTGLTSLSGYFNPIYGTIPRQFGALISLNTMVIGGGELTGSFPSTLSNIHQLSQLKLYGCEFSGSFEPLPTWKSLSQLYLQECYFNSIIPSEIGKSTSQLEVTLDYDSYIPDEIYTWSNVQSLTLESFRGAISSRIGEMNILRSLIISISSTSGVTPSLRIGGNLITGSLPCEIGQLRNLQTLFIEYTSLSGVIPSEIGHLLSLQALHLEYTSFSGVMPSEIGQLRSLQTITIESTSISGAIPSEIGLLTELSRLYLISNYLTSIPPQIGQLRYLQYLDFGYNRITELSSGIGKLTRLTSLSGYFNPIYGTIPCEFGGLISLNYLAIGGEFTGTVPSALSNIHQLSQLKLYGCEFSGSFEPLPTWKSLSQLYLQECYFNSIIPSGIRMNSSQLEVTLDYDCYIPDGVYTWSNVRSLTLKSFQGTISSSIGQMKTLRSLSISRSGMSGPTPSLYISSDSISGSLPSEIGQLRILQILYIESTSFSGAMPSEIGQLQNLQTLHIRSIPFSGAMPSEIGQLQSLQTLHIESISFSGVMPSEIGQLRSLQTLYIESTSFSGEVPSNIGQLRSLQTLTILSTSFSGSMPSQIGQLRSLQTLTIESTSISGFIPSEIGLLTELSELHISSNDFTSISPQIGQLKRLQTLDFGCNYITELSSGIAKLTSLTSLIGYSNPLYGTIPSEFGGLNSLNYMNIGGGEFLGSFPSALSNINNLYNLQLQGCSFWNSFEILLAWEFLAILYLQDCYFGSSIPSEIGESSSLSDVTLDYDSNIPEGFYGWSTIVSLTLVSFRGTISPSIGQIKNLQSLCISGSLRSGATPCQTCFGDFGIPLQYLSTPPFGSMPSEFAQFPHLENLCIESTSITGSIPSEIGQLQKLQTLYIEYTPMTGSLPSAIGQSLENLYADLTTTTGSVHSEIGHLRSLQVLHIDHTSMTGSIPSEISKLQNLNIIHIQYTSMTGSIPSEIGELNLDSLLIAFTSMSGTIPSEIWQMKSLSSLAIGSISVSGTIPSEINQLQSLMSLGIGPTAISGTIPSELSQLKYLSTLSLSNNAFSGSFPMWLMYLDGLSSLDLSANCFHGELVCHDNKVFGEKLLSVDLSMLTSGLSCIGYVWKRPSNGKKKQVNSLAGFYPRWHMTGSIPNCFWSAQNDQIDFIYLSGNGFTGTVPDLPLKAGMRLTYIDLSYNQLTGHIPNYSSEVNGVDVTWTNNRLSGTICSFNRDEVANNRLSGNFPLQLENVGDLSSYFTFLQESYFEGNLMQFSLSNIGVPNTVQNQMQLMGYNGSQLLNVSIVVVSIFYGALATVTILYLSLMSSMSLPAVKTLKVWWNTSRNLISGIHLNGVKRTIQYTTLVLTGSASLYILFKLTPLSIQYSTHMYQYGWTVSAAFLHGLAPAVLLTLLVCYLSIAFVISTRVSPREKQLDLNSSASSSTTTSSFWICIAIDFILFTFNFVIMFVANAAYLGGALIFSDFLPQSSSTSTLYGSVGELLLALVKLVWKGVMFRLSSGAKTLLSLQLKESILFHVLVQSVSFLIIPAICVAIYSQNCFLQLFVDTSNMPFMYSYQCGSALIVKYVPVLFYAYAMSGQFRLVVMLLYMLYSKGKERSFWLLLFNVPGVLSLQPLSSGKTFLPTVRIASRLVLNTVICLTFGVAYPYLGFIAVVSSVLEVVMWMLALGRYLTMKKMNDIGGEREQSSEIDDSMEPKESIGILSTGSLIVTVLDDLVVEEIQRCTEIVQQEIMSVMMLSILFVFVFWGCISFDMIADVHGMQKGLDAMIVIMVVCPVLVLAISVVWLRFVDKCSFCPVAALIGCFGSVVSLENKKESDRPVDVYTVLQPLFDDTESNSEIDRIDSSSPNVD